MFRFGRNITRTFFCWTFQEIDGLRRSSVWSECRLSLNTCCTVQTDSTNNQYQYATQPFTIRMLFLLSKKQRYPSSNHCLQRCIDYPFIHPRAKWRRLGSLHICTCKIVNSHNCLITCADQHIICLLSLNWLCIINCNWNAVDSTVLLQNVIPKNIAR
jgi:hypothetical protein